MPDDPLTKPIEDWTPADLENLRGASESEYLELKGEEVDINSLAGRTIVALTEGLGEVFDDGHFICSGQSMSFRLESRMTIEPLSARYELLAWSQFVINRHMGAI